jgi:hypothetical protein
VTFTVHTVSRLPAIPEASRSGIGVDATLPSPAPDESHWGGTRNGTIVHWPNGSSARGETRHQFHHVIDVAPTVLEVAGFEDDVWELYAPHDWTQAHDLAAEITAQLEVPQSAATSSQPRTCVRNWRRSRALPGDAARVVAEKNRGGTAPCHNGARADMAPDQGGMR